MTPICIAVVGRTLELSERVKQLFQRIECHLLRATLETAMRILSDHRPDVVLIVTHHADPSPEIDCLRQLRLAYGCSRYIFLTSASSEEIAIRVFHCGAERLLKEPWTAPMLIEAIGALVPTLVRDSHCKDLVGGSSLIGRSQAVQALRAQLALISPTPSNVLIVGETGTGKELVAELVHRNGARANGPFVCINTTALPDTLVESELFGHERGAFTGATAAQQGKFSAANGGTVFLDEIGDVSLNVQAKLLRAIENKSVYRLGGTRSIRLDVRIVAATNQNLERALEQGTFRRDLYYRLNVVRVHLPSLRERQEDIPLLAAHFIRHFNKELGRSIRGLSGRAMGALCGYHWPGNVRELRNVIEAMMVNLAPETTGLVDIPPPVMRQLAFALGAPASERERLLGALTATNWNKSKAASQLHWSRMTLYRKMHEHNVGLTPVKG